MVQIYKEPKIPGNFRDSFQNSLNNFINVKLGQLQERQQGKKTADGLQSLGITKEAASQISMLPPELQTTVVKNLMAQRERAEYSNILSGGQKQQGFETGYSPQEEQTSQLEAGIVPFESPQRQPQTGSQDALAQILQQALGGQPQQAEEVIAQPKQKVMQPIEKQPSQTERYDQILKNPLLKPEHRLRIEAMKQQQDIANKKESTASLKEERAEQHRINKELAPIKKQIDNEYKDSRDDDRRLNRQLSLIDKGDLSRPRWHSFLNTLENGIFGFGINLHSLETADSQEFDKLSKEFIKGAKSIFGSRITDTDLRTFLKMIPDLSQSREGKLAVIKNMKSYNEAAKIRKKASDEVIRENNGRIPFDYEQRMEEKVGTQLDDLAKTFITSEVPKESKKDSSIFDLKNPLDLLLGKG